MFLMIIHNHSEIRHCGGEGSGMCKKVHLAMDSPQDAAYVQFKEETKRGFLRETLQTLVVTFDPAHCWLEGDLLDLQEMLWSKHELPTSGMLTLTNSDNSVSASELKNGQMMAAF